MLAAQMTTEEVMRPAFISLFFFFNKPSFETLFLSLNRNLKPYPLVWQPNLKPYSCVETLISDTISDLKPSFETLIRNILGK